MHGWLFIVIGWTSHASFAKVGQVIAGINCQMFDARHGDKKYKKRGPS